jgi:hypothetical protein
MADAGAGMAFGQTKPDSKPSSMVVRQGAHHNDIRWDLVPGEEGDDLAGIWQAPFLHARAGRGGQQQRSSQSVRGTWEVPYSGLLSRHLAQRQPTQLVVGAAPAGPG